ncbi:MAG: FKBP-type peptidyl-prolyl cis-trans isomerase N-terminal domain-containing protein, partial [Spirochaetales bacterium]|nr:FKBP-type peptidyl-prolyl cis-trans isomerase N-terminal domain-containing protein [Candidatus Physcosoma equi]
LGLLASLVFVLASCTTTYEVQEPYIIRAPRTETKTTTKVEQVKTEPAPVPAGPETPVETIVSPTSGEEKTEELPVLVEAPSVEPEALPIVMEEEAPSIVEPIPEATEEEEQPVEMLEEILPIPFIPEAIEEETTTEEVVVEEETVIQYFEPVAMDELFPSFNYAYGINAMLQLREQGIDFIASYFARGVYDACSDRYHPTLMAVTDTQPAVDDYVVEYLYEGKNFEPGKRPESITEVMALPVPTDIPSRFSYAYAFDMVVDLLESEVDILPTEFITGALDTLYGIQTLDANQIQTYINAYIIFLNEEFYKAEANKSESNLEKAELFLDRNGKREEVKTLASGIQLELLGEDEVVGTYPTIYDVVLIDYNLYVMDYETEDLEMIDADWGRKLKLEEADYSLRESVLNMKVGQAQRSYIPPQIGLSDTSLYDTEPNSILVYDIALNGIVE